MNISVMIDIVIIAALVIFAALGWKRGLIRTLTELAAVVVAVALSTQIAKAAAPKIIDQYLRPATYAAIEQRAEEISKETFDAVSPQEKLNQVLEAIPNDFVREKAQDALGGVFVSGETLSAPLAEMGKDMADTVLDTLVRDVIQSILCALLFAVLTFLLRILTKVLRIIEKLPGIRQLNELGGALVGLGKGLIVVCLAVWVLRQTGLISVEAARESVVLGFLPGWISGIGK